MVRIQVWLRSLALIGGGYAVTDNYTNSDCPLLGPDQPVPTGLSSSPYLQQVVKSFPQALAGGNYGKLDLAKVSFSASVFSAADNATLYTLYNTADSVKTAHTGVTKVDGDSVYRLGSISKLLTVYAILSEIGDRYWNDAITQYIPELQQAASNHSTSSNIDQVQWADVTLGELASHMAGITRDATLGDLAANGLKLLPNLPSSQIPTCGATTTEQPCSRSDFFKYLLQHHPSLPTSATTPAYSNAGFVLLAYAFEAISKTTMESAMNRLFAAAGMSGASFNESDPKTGVIPFGNQSASWWNVATGNEAAAGGYFASNNDMVKLGQSMLQHSILSPAMTRRWMKPDALVSDINMAVGKPWEIRRIKDQNNKVTDYYTKEVGMAVNFVDDKDTEGSSLHVVADALVGEFMPAIQRAAKDQAAKNLAGKYVDKSTNSSIQISTDSQPGMNLESFNFGGHDVLAKLQQLQGASGKPSVRLYPTGLSAQSPRNGSSGSYVSRLGYKAVFAFLPLADPERGAFGTNCESWTVIDSMNYGLTGLDEVQFTLSETGDALAVTMRALRIPLMRQ